MHKIWLICKREYLTRVKKKSFLVMTLLSPLLIVLFYGIIFYFSFNRDLAEEKKIILVSDATGLFSGKLENTKTITFSFEQLTDPLAKNLLKAENAYGVLFINQKDSIINYDLLANEQPGLNTLSAIEEKLENVVKSNKLAAKGIDKTVLKEINDTHVNVSTRKNTEDGYEKGNSGVTTMIGFLGAFLIYFFIFLYGVQVMKGVIEEKTNRIVEVIISSVKPFQLMMGKITGIALVGLTQFIIWVALVLLLSGPVSSLVMNLQHVEPSAITANGQETLSQAKEIGAAGILSELGNFNYVLIIGLFIFYFIGGYLFYGALFAAVGSAVDNETDTQQFMMPITLPLIFSIAIAQSIINAPNSSLSVWLSMIPFSSPVIMMVRLPFGIPTSEIIASMLCMIIGFVGTVWFAGRIYRIGILTYGKKPTYKELFKWLFRKN
ncbi:MAG: ABC transporter permease [Bacteroidia bacterium]|nr:ABC transporter permease [Bacteroidia bacterium]MCF8426203.1 ABC transporter permease [Bacteroidia bacterium]MCF8446255.1 ABC transporter permease [Bacteroidia bacterium]